MPTDYAYLAARLPGACRLYVAPLLVGDHLAGAMTAARVTPRRAAELCIDLAEENRSPSACRALLYGAWCAENLAVIEAAGMPHRLAALLEYAGVPHPGGEVVTLWRGVAATAPEDAARGLCWTDNYAAACFFALRQQGRKALPPWVVSATFPAGSVFVLHYDLPTVGGQAREYIAPEPPEAVELVGDAEEWRNNAALAGLSAVLALPGRFRDGWERYSSMRQRDRDGEDAA